MSRNSENKRYTEEEARKEADLMKEKVKSGQVKNYDEAEKIVEKEKKESEVDWKKKYEERKAMIKTPDDVMYERVHEKMNEAKKGSELSDNIYSLSEYSTTWNFVQESNLGYDKNLDINKNAIWLAKLSRGRKLINIGCGGKEGLFRADNHIGGTTGSEKQVVLDPYFNEDEMNEIIRDEKYERLEFKQDDALHYLLDQKDESNNVFVSNMEYAVLVSGDENFPASDWMKRVAQEVYRVVPNGGYFITVGCDREFDEEAKKLFEESRKFTEHGETTIYLKKIRKEKEIIDKEILKMREDIFRLLDELAIDKLQDDDMHYDILSEGFHTRSISTKYIQPLRELISNLSSKDDVTFFKLDLESIYSKLDNDVQDSEKYLSKGTNKKYNDLLSYLKTNLLK